MSFPVGVTTVACKVPVPVDFDGGGVLTLKAKIELVAPSTNSVIWAATGVELAKLVSEVTQTSGTDIIFNLPAVDQAGWKDSSGAAYSDWAYRVTYSATRKMTSSGGRTVTAAGTSSTTKLIKPRLVDAAGGLNIGQVASQNARGASIVSDSQFDVLADAIDEVGTLAYVENRSGDLTYSTGPGAPIPGMAISVPATDRDVWLEWGCAAALAIGGEGVLNTIVYEITGGGAALTGLMGSKFEANAIASAQGPQYEGRVRIGPADHERVFQLYLAHYSGTGSGMVGYIYNGDTAYNKTYFTAEAR